LTLTRVLVAAAVFIAPVAAAHGQGVEGLRSVTVFVGTGASLAGNAIEEGVGTINGKPAVIVEQALSNHFSDGLRLRFSGGLGLDYNKEVFATFAWGKYNGTHRIIGAVAGSPLTARFANTDAFDIEGGVRYYLRPEGPIRAYLAPTVGIRFLEATTVSFQAFDLGLSLDNQPYFKSSALLLIGGDAGASVDVSDHLAFGLEFGLRYQGKPEPDTLFTDPGLRAVNDTGRRWTVPISLFVKARF